MLPARERTYPGVGNLTQLIPPIFQKHCPEMGGAFVVLIHITCIIFAVIFNQNLFKMKKLLLCILVSIPLLCFSQQPIPADVIAGFDTYVQLSQMSVTLIGAKHFTTVGSDPNKLHEIVKENGKAFIFQSEAEVFNYMAKQGPGFDFVAFGPIWPADEYYAKTSNVLYYRKIIFKKRGS